MKRYFVFLVLVLIDIGTQHKALSADAAEFRGARNLLQGVPSYAEVSGKNDPIADRIQVAPTAYMSSVGGDDKIRVNTFAQMGEKGFVDADSVETEYVTAAVQNPQLFDKSGGEENKLTFVPASLEGTWLEQAQYLGMMYGGGFHDGKRSTATRLFSLPGIGYALFGEWDFMIGNSRTVIPQESINFEVNGMPGTYLVLKAPDETSLSQFKWYGGTKGYELNINAPATEGSELFESIREFAAAVSGR